MVWLRENKEMNRKLGWVYGMLYTCAQTFLHTCLEIQESLKNSTSGGGDCTWEELGHGVWRSEAVCHWECICSLLWYSLYIIVYVFFKIYFIDVSVWIYVTWVECLRRPEKGVGARVTMVVRCLVWMLGAKLGSPGRAPTSLTLWTALQPYYALILPCACFKAFYQSINSARVEHGGTHL